MASLKLSVLIALLGRADGRCHCQPCARYLRLRCRHQPATHRCLELSAFDLGFIESATRKIAEVATSDKIVVEKSTVPCRTAESVRDILIANGKLGVNFDVLSNNGVLG